MNAARVAESDVAAQDSCTTEVHLPRLQDNRLMERKTMKLIVLPQKNSEQNCLPRNLHFSPPFLDPESNRSIHSQPVSDFGDGALFSILRPESSEMPNE